MRHIGREPVVHGMLHCRMRISTSERIEEDVQVPPDLNCHCQVQAGDAGDVHVIGQCEMP